MAEKIVMPKLAMSMKQGKVIEWVFAEGQHVEKEQVVLVIETEKVTYEVEAPVSGFLHIIVPLEETVPIHETLAYVAENEAELAALQSEVPEAAPATPALIVEPEPAEPAIAEAVGAVPDEPAAPLTIAAPEMTPSPVAEPTSGRKVKISPLARKIAAQHNLDVFKIVGTGPGGRIKKRDVIAFMEQPAPIPAPPAPAVQPVPTETTMDGKQIREILPWSGMRQAMATHMTQSLSTYARVSVFIEIDMEELIQLRKSLVQEQETMGTRISFTDLFVFITARVLKSQPLLNSTYTDEGIVVWEDINIGVALSLAKGEMDTDLVVPVIKNADRKSLIEISKELKSYVRKGRDGTLSPGDMSGGTFTFTNTAQLMKRWHLQTPMITQPESTILGTSSTVQKAVVKNGEIVARPMMPVQLSFDHRVMDGSQPTAFLGKFADWIEKPDLIWSY